MNSISRKRKFDQNVEDIDYYDDSDSSEDEEDVESSEDDNDHDEKDKITLIESENKEEKKEITEEKNNENKLSEKWAGLPENLNFPSYEVSSFGRLRNKETNRMLSPSKSKSGYIMIMLRSYSRRKNCRVHRLVALAFLPNPENKPEVDHIDRNRTNNLLSNLRWATKAEQRENQKNPAEYNVRKKSVVKLMYGKVVKTFKNIKKAAKALGVAQSVMSKYCNKGMIVNGYVYKYWTPEYAKNKDDWKQVPPLYVPTEIWACRDGSVFINGAITKGSIEDDGYCKTTYKSEHKRYKFMVHILVCLAFHGAAPDEIKTTVNHDNGKKTDNRPENLHWASGSEQLKHALSIGLLKIKKIPVIQLSLDGEVIKEFPSITAAAKAVGLNSYDGIRGVCNGKWKTAGGFKWKYKT